MSGLFKLRKKVEYSIMLTKEPKRVETTWQITVLQPGGRRLSEAVFKRKVRQLIGREVPLYTGAKGIIRQEIQQK